jgi:hypothetical protein
MRMLTARPLCRLALALCLGFALPTFAVEDEKESPELKAKKARTAEPKDSDIDKSASLESLLAKKGPKDWSDSKAAVIEGKIVQIEKEPDDGDYHVTLAPAGSETDTTKWVIVEVTPAWGKKKPALSPASVDKLRGKTVRVTGWLFYEPEEPHHDPRGTNWEIHPVTNLAPTDH